MQELSDSCCQHSRSKHSPPVRAHTHTHQAPTGAGRSSDALILDVQKVQNYDLMEMMQIITLPASIMCVCDSPALCNAMHSVLSTHHNCIQNAERWCACLINNTGGYIWTIYPTA